MTGPIPKIVFATGDSAISNAITYVTFIPMVVMFLAMIPPGAEGTIFALITTWQNLAGEVGYDFGTLLECVWPVKNEELKDHQWQNLTTLTWVTSAIQCMPCLWVYLKVKNVRVVSPFVEPLETLKLFKKFLIAH